MKLTLTKSDNLDDWYLIERAEHDGRSWLAPTAYGAQLMCSSRISDADVEGTAEEMREIAKAIRDRGSYAARRCAVRITGDVALFRSPRNSMNDGSCSLTEADELAAKIEQKCGVADG